MESSEIEMKQLIKSDKRKTQRKMRAQEDHIVKMMEQLGINDDDSDGSCQEKKPRNEHKQPRFVIDWQKYGVMQLGDMLKQVEQIHRVNQKKFHVFVVGMELNSQMILCKTLPNWNQQLSLSSATLYDTFPLQDVVQITQDSQNVLETLDPTMVYLIGSATGSVLNNNTKNPNYRQVRLPIVENLGFEKELTVTQVFEVLKNFWISGDWKSAFAKVI